MRRSGPDGMSRIPVASTTKTPGRPSANRRYQSITSRVTKPSSVARHGTIAGTQVRAHAVRLPIATGVNRRARAAASADGQCAIGSACFLRSAGCHIPTRGYHGHRVARCTARYSAGLWPVARRNARAKFAGYPYPS